MTSKHKQREHRNYTNKIYTTSYISGGRAFPVQQLAGNLLNMRAQASSLPRSTTLYRMSCAKKFIVIISISHRININIILF